MKRTLMLKNQELLDFEIDLVTGEIRIIDAPDTDDPLLGLFCTLCGWVSREIADGTPRFP